MGCDLGSSPDFVMLAKAYGGQGRMVRGPAMGGPCLPASTRKPGLLPMKISGFRWFPVFFYMYFLQPSMMGQECGGSGFEKERAAR